MKQSCDLVQCIIEISIVNLPIHITSQCYVTFNVHQTLTGVFIRECWYYTCMYANMYVCTMVRLDELIL